ncbi:MAG: hypothetical protein RQ756_06535 [Flavobacteriaceae bacterium]|nr:hypothetical protein [Flavobacteriaceae bacterium]
MKRTIQFIQNEPIVAFIFLMSFLFLLRSLILPLRGDEITYYKLAENILNGRYYQSNNPSSIAPVIPFLTALFKLNSWPITGVILQKLFNIFLVAMGLLYVKKTLNQLDISPKISLLILCLSIINPISIAFLSSLYPEPVIFFLFWGFMYYILSKPNVSNLIFSLGFLISLCLTRYVFLVLGLVMLWSYRDYIKQDFSKYKWILLKYSFFAILPLILWFKYVYWVENQNLSEISYFERFKDENPWIYNIKAGLGLLQHYETSRVNGVPAFVSLFVPITGIRNFPMSILLIVLFIIGYLSNLNSTKVSKLFVAIILVFLGYALAGTGFSRYWMPLLPGILIGYYFLIKRIIVKEKWMIYAGYALAFIYIANELRLTFKIISSNI